MQRFIRLLCVFFLFCFIFNPFDNLSTATTAGPESTPEEIISNPPETTPFVTQEQPVPYQSADQSLEQILLSREPSASRSSRDWSQIDICSVPYGAFWLESYSMSELINSSEQIGNGSYQYDFHYYNLTDEEIDDMKKEIDAAVQEIISQIPKNSDRWETILAVHDALVESITYDTSLNAPHTRDPYGALVNHNAVCLGYATAFKHVLDCLGIPSSLVFSDTHAWNYIDGIEDGYIDTTWDDMESSGSRKISHSYFFLPRDEIIQIDNHYIIEEDPGHNASYHSPYNYHAHEGFLLSRCEAELVRNLFLIQQQKDPEFFTVRFSNDSAYQTMLSWADTGDLSAILQELGYGGHQYRQWQNDSLRVVDIEILP